MTEALNSSHELHEAILNSPGMAHRNRSHSRSFSLNIFQMNALELIEITRHVRDPDQGVQLMSDGNREAGWQAHREVNRRVHNFVAAAKSLIDHTRVFVQTHYGSTAFESLYLSKVQSDFREEPVAKFVQELRNYMLHKGLPSSQMFVKFEKDPSNPDGSGEITSGVRYRAAQLLDWGGWTEPSRNYIGAAGKHLEIHDFAEKYLGKVLRFHAWLDDELDLVHADDLARLDALQDAYHLLEEASEADVVEQAVLPDASVEISPPLPFEFSISVAADIDSAGAEILANVRKLKFGPRQEEGFRSDRPLGASITPDQMLEPPMIWNNDAEGRRVFAFIRMESDVFGLDEEAHSKLGPLGDLILNAGWAKKMLSRKFVDDVVIRWCRSSFCSSNTVGLSGEIAERARVAVVNFEVWVPIAHLEVESRFSFGPIDIVLISRQMIDALAERGHEYAPQHKDNAAKLFEAIRDQMQGFAAVVSRFMAEPIRAKQDGVAIANDAVGLLRFFSPAADRSWQLCPTAPLGSEIIPTSKVLVIGEDTFTYTDGVIPNSVAYWSIDNEDLSDLYETGLNEVGNLISTENLDDFSLSIRSSLLLYGTGITFSDYLNRLVYTISALEGLLLKHGLEPVGYNIGVRMGLMLSRKASVRAEVERNVRDAYRLRGRNNSSGLSSHEEDIFMIFVRNSHEVISMALNNIDNFYTKEAFIEAIDALKGDDC